LRVFDEKGEEVFWAEVNKDMLIEFFRAAQQPGEHTISLHLATNKKWLVGQHEVEDENEDAAEA